MASERTSGKPRVLVMMSTYNGQDYLAYQIDSILNQQDVEVFLTIADDGSSDDTCAICQEYADSHENISFSQNAHNKGIAKNFMDLVFGADANAYDYFAFSDQDDYWLPEKLTCAIQNLQGHEEDPALYYSDVCNVNPDLSGGEPEYISFKPCQNNICMVAIYNWAAGCTMVFNGKLCTLLQKAPLDKFHRLHDSWVHFVALSCGTVIPDLESSYIKRRITGHNSYGIYSIGHIDFSRIAGMMRYLVQESDHFAVYAAQDLLRYYSSDIHAQYWPLLADFAMMDTSLLKRVKIAGDPHFTMPFMKENLVQKVRVLLNKL